MHRPRKCFGQKASPEDIYYENHGIRGGLELPFASFDDSYS